MPPAAWIVAMSLPKLPEEMAGWCHRPSTPCTSRPARSGETLMTGTWHRTGWTGWPGRRWCRRSRSTGRRRAGAGFCWPARCWHWLRWRRIRTWPPSLLRQPLRSGCGRVVSCGSLRRRAATQLNRKVSCLMREASPPSGSPSRARPGSVTGRAPGCPVGCGDRRTVDHGYLTSKLPAPLYYVDRKISLRFHGGPATVLGGSRNGVQRDFWRQEWI